MSSRSLQDVIDGYTAANLTQNTLLTNIYAGLTPRNRVHVQTPELWNRALGTDYWAYFGPEVIAAAAGSSALLSDSGWTTTSLVETAGTGADFLSATDRAAPAHILTDAASDLIQSPAIFGTRDHKLAADYMLGVTTTKLVLEFGAAFTVSSNAETATAIGLVEAGGSPVTANDALAMIYSDGTNFKIRSGAGASGAGPLVDTAWHDWKITLDSSVAAGTAMVSWTVDGVAGPTLDLETDLFPCSFGGGVVAAGSNRVGISYAHVYYTA